MEAMVMEAMEDITVARGVLMLSLATSEDMEDMEAMVMEAMEDITVERGVLMLSLATSEDMEDMEAMVMEAMEDITVARGVLMLNLATSEDMEDMVDIEAMVAMEDLDTVVRWKLLSLKVIQLANITFIQFCKNMKNKSIK